MNTKSEKEKLAEDVVDRWVSFQMALSSKRKYPTEEFTAFAASVRGYVRAINRDPLIHREVATAINGLVDFLKVERRQVPDENVRHVSLGMPYSSVLLTELQIQIRTDSLLAGQKFCFLIFNCLIFDSRVEGGIPSLAAAPFTPATFPLVSARAASIISFS